MKKFNRLEVMLLIFLAIQVAELIERIIEKFVL